MASFENSVVVAKNLNFDLAAAKPHLGVIDAAGKLPIGTGNTFPTPEILAGSITSPMSTINIGYSSPNITLDVAGGGGGNFVLNTPVITGIDYTATGPTLVYTPTSDFVVESGVFVWDNVVSDSGGLVLSLGTNNPNYDNISLNVGPTAGSSGTITVVSISTGSPIPLVPSGTPIFFNIIVGETATTCTGRFFLIGSNLI